MKKIFTIQMVLIGIAGLSVLFFNNGIAATISSASCSYEDVKAAYDSASEEDTIIVPAGAATWLSTLTVTKSLTIRGMTKECPDACVDNTVITSAGSNKLIVISVTGDKTIDISGLTLDANEDSQNGSVLSITNHSDTDPLYNLRIHHNNIRNAYGRPIYILGMVFGLIDSNHFYDNRKDIGVGGSDAISWTLFPATDNFGTKNYLYFEDNISDLNHYICLGSGNGGRWVFRHNTIKNARGDGCLDAHGDTNNRGVVAFEVYENTVERINNKARFLDYRGGSGIIYNNEVTLDTTRTCVIKVREETDGCTVDTCDGSDGGDEVQNGYIWNNTDPGNGNTLEVVEEDVLSYTSGGSYEPSRGDNVIGETSGATTSLRATPHSPKSGAWADGDAVGYLNTYVVTGTFSFPENITIQGNSNTATVIKGDYIKEKTNWWDNCDNSPEYFTTGTKLPANCSVGDCFYDTDAEHGDNYGTGALYRCTETDTWRWVYSPYIYPHPLRFPSPPSNLTIK